MADDDDDEKYPKLKRDAHGRILPGQKSLNPKGKPPGQARMARYIRRRTQHYRALVDFALNVMSGEIPGFRGSDRMTAHAWLADRGLGKAGQVIELTGPDGAPLGALPNFAALTEAEMLAWRVLVAKAASTDPVETAIDVTPKKLPREISGEANAPAFDAEPEDFDPEFDRDDDPAADG